MMSNEELRELLNARLPCPRPAREVEDWCRAILDLRDVLRLLEAELFETDDGSSIVVSYSPDPPVEDRAAGLLRCLGPLRITDIREQLRDLYPTARIPEASLLIALQLDPRIHKEGDGRYRLAENGATSPRTDRVCGLCGGAIEDSSKEKYCSAACRSAANKGNSWQVRQSAAGLQMMRTLQARFNGKSPSEILQMGLALLHATQPGGPSTVAAEPAQGRRPTELVRVATQVHAGKRKIATIRELLRWFGYSHRRSSVVSEIRQALDELKLTTRPSFWISSNVDEQVEFVAEAGASTVDVRMAVAGKGVSWRVTDGMLNIQVDLSRDFGPSSSGKSTIIASTEGNVEVGEGIKMGLNAYRPRR